MTSCFKIFGFFIIIISTIKTSFAFGSIITSSPRIIRNVVLKPSFSNNYHSRSRVAFSYNELILRLRGGGGGGGDKKKIPHLIRNVLTNDNNHESQDASSPGVAGIRRLTEDQKKVLQKLSKIMLILGYQGILFGLLKLLIGLFWIMFKRPYRNYYYTHSMVSTLMNTMNISDNHKMQFLVKYLKFPFILLEKIEILSGVDLFIGKLKSTDIAIIVNHLLDLFIAKLLRDGGLAFKYILHEKDNDLQNEQQQQGENSKTKDDVDYLFDGLDKFYFILRRKHKPFLIKWIAVMGCIARIFGKRRSIPGLSEMEFSQFYEMF